MRGVIVDDHSRYLLALRFFLTKEQEGVLYTLYLAFCEYGFPSCILVDRGGQFYSALQGAETVSYTHLTLPTKRIV